MTLTKTPADWRFIAAKAKADRERRNTAKQAILHTLELIDDATPDIQDAVRLAAPLILTRVLGVPVRPTHVDELAEFRNEMNVGDDEAFTVYHQRYEDMVSEILAQVAS